MVTIVGWILVLFPVVLVLYTYLLYPSILWLLARTRRSTTHRLIEFPLVSIAVPAYNEEAQIRGAIEALIAQDYPADRRQILIMSDASADRTDAIVSEYFDRGVELLRMPVRGGKTAAENAAIALLRGDIIINSDSSVRMHPSAVRRLIEAMADPRVGVASTRDVSVARADAAANATEAGYVDYEMKIRRLETQVDGIVGASGSGYAIRANLHRFPIRADLSRDFSAALTARTHGYMAVSVDDAICYVPRTASLKSEYKRKVRTIARGLETLQSQSHLMDPIRFGLFSWKLLSHKLCRWLVPPSVILAAIGLVLLAPTYWWAGALLAAGLVIGLLAILGAAWPSSKPIPRFLSLITFAVSANIAVLHALARVAAGREDQFWEPTRRSPVFTEGTAGHA